MVASAFLRSASDNAFSIVQLLCCVIEMSLLVVDITVCEVAFLIPNSLLLSKLFSMFYSPHYNRRCGHSSLVSWGKVVSHLVTVRLVRIFCRSPLFGGLCLLFLVALHVV